MTRFPKDLLDGKNAEECVCNLYNKHGLHSEIIDPKSPDRAFWDISTKGRDLEFTTEVKFDKYEAKSGNLAIETFNPRRGKPSGIGITKAFFWAHVLVDNAIWLTTTAKLRQFMQEEKPLRIVKCGGDGNAQLSLYQNTHILPAIFFRIDNISLRPFLKYLRSVLHE